MHSTDILRLYCQILLVPWVRVAYMALKRRIYRAVLHPLLGKPPDTRESRDHRRRRVIVVGEDNHLVDADPPPGADAVEEGPGEGEGGEAQQTIYVTHQSLGRLILGALSLPVIANGAGAALGYAARWSTTLSRILGIGTSAAGLPVLAHYPLKSPLASLFSGDWLSPGTGGTASRGSGSSFASWLHDSSLPTSYDDLDPIWWRNALGAGLFIIGRDALALLFRWMRLRQRRRTRIADLPFEQGLVAGLDLRL